MSLAYNLDRDLVPEWRIKYVDYRQGKRHIKAIARALNRVNASTRHPIPGSPLATRDNSRVAPLSSVSGRKINLSIFQSFDFTPIIGRSTIRDESSPRPRILSTSPGFPTERNEKKDDPSPRPKILSLSSGFPTERNEKKDDPSPRPKILSSYSLNQSRISINSAIIGDNIEKSPKLSINTTIASGNSKPNDDFVNKDRNQNDPISRDFANTLQKQSIFSPSTIGSVQFNSPPGGANHVFNKPHRMPDSPKSFLSDVFSGGGVLSPAESHQTNLDLGAADIYRQRHLKFFKWMDEELEKVETFYKMKEDEADSLLTVLREQLYEMRTRRVEELAEREQMRALGMESQEPSNYALRSEIERKCQMEGPSSRLDSIFKPITHNYLKLRHKLAKSHVDTSSMTMKDIRTSTNFSKRRSTNSAGRSREEKDYVRRSNYDNNVSHRTAKRKLKLAMLECYRGMEMLKSYAVINQMAFKKINRKYYKVVGTNPALRVLSEKVNRSWFVRSNVLDVHIHEAIDLYARYFENGHHKIALGKLRGSFAPRADASAKAFRNGVLIGVGTVFGIQGIIHGVDMLNNHPDPVIRTQVSNLFQLYAGYFLALYLFAFFCLDCCIWTRFRINYQFVFEFDPRRTLDWREMAIIPSFLLAFLGLCMWINFSQVGGPQMFIYYPVILILATVVVILVPAPVLFHRGRVWFIYSNWRLLLAGLYPVEFRDFFLGDMYCSLTYVMANIEVFFCLYLNHWVNPAQCGSTNSKLLGFFTALPAVWRALQCLRRYYDTRDIFPHLINCGKYISTILFYTTLSIYRIRKTRLNIVFFLISASITSIYSSLWDILMDWSLLQPNARVRFLRDVRGYKDSWWYYAAMILNPLLRFGWILYLTNIFVLGHSSKVTFIVAVAEVTRRGIWAIFRVENEHCSNVAHFKASRAPQLPYTTASDPKDIVALEIEDPNNGQLNNAPTMPNLEAQQSPGSHTMRRQLTKILAEAHMKDFEKKRKRSTTKENSSLTVDHGSETFDSSDDEEEHESDEQVVFNIAALLKERRRIARETAHDEVVSPGFVKSG